MLYHVKQVLKLVVMFLVFAVWAVGMASLITMGVIAVSTVLGGS